MKKNTIIIIIIVLLSGVGLFFSLNKSKSSDNQKADSNKIKAVIYKSPTCGCCVKYISYLEKQGFNVEIKTTQNMTAIKNKHQIPQNMESCHTMIIDNYFIEGHVPIEAINKLLTEKPDIDGISLPEMPSGTPGMPGRKTENWQIYSLFNGQISEYINL